MSETNTAEVTTTTTEPAFIAKKKFVAINVLGDWVTYDTLSEAMEDAMVPVYTENKVDLATQTLMGALTPIYEVDLTARTVHPVQESTINTTHHL